MELVEVQARTPSSAAVNDGDAGAEEDGANAKKSGGTKTWVLRSCLSSDIMTKANEIMIPPDDDYSEDQAGGDWLFSWNRADELGMIGLVHVILSLILVSGRTLGQGKGRTRAYTDSPTNVFVSQQPNSGPTSADSPSSEKTIETRLFSQLQLSTPIHSRPRPT